MKPPDPVKPSVAIPAPDPSTQPSAAFRPVASTPPARAAHPVPAAAPVSVPPAPLPRTARGRGEPTRTATASPAPARTATEPAAPKKKTDWHPMTVAEPRQAPSPAAEDLTVARPAMASPQEDLLAPPTPSASPSPATVNFSSFPPEEDSEPEDAAYGTASRLGGLRNLLVSLGRRTLGKDPEIQPAERELEPRFERATVRPVYTASYASTTESELEETSSTALRVVAQPEFLPPKPVVEAEKEKEPVRAATSPARWELGDEPETLPSVRGQYRKKRYPQM